MIPHLREAFNRNFTTEKYQQLLQRLDDLCGVHIQFRVCETPAFVPATLMKSMASAGIEILQQLMSNAEYRKASARAIPATFNVPNETTHPLFVAVDFGLTQNERGEYQPKLIELQGFPTLFAYQMTLSSVYKEVFDLPRELTPLLGGLDLEGYHSLLRRAILADHSPEEVILMEIDPLTQKTLPDFILTERICGIPIINIRDVIKQGRRLFYKKGGTLKPIRRIYNRVIVDELIKLNARLPFDFRDELDVEWAGHPNWFFRISKFSIPYIHHPAVPKTMFLSDTRNIPDDLENWVLKPLFSFAGSGVKVEPTKDDITNIGDEDKSDFILQERVDYIGAIETPSGGTKAEVRIMYFWLDELLPVNNLVRMGRGKMMGVDHNKNMSWVGSSAGLSMY